MQEAEFRITKKTFKLAKTEKQYCDDWDMDIFSVDLTL